MLVPISKASIVTYTDGAQFAQASQNMSAIDYSYFNAMVSGPGGWNLNYTSSGFTLGTTGNTVQFLGMTNANTYYTNISWGQNNQRDWGPMSHAIIESGQYNSDPNRGLLITLPGAGATAIGLDLMTWLETSPYNGTSYKSGDSVMITLSTGEVLGPILTTAWVSSLTSSSPRSAGLNPTFFGVTSDIPITWIKINSTNSVVATDYFTFGNKVDSTTLAAAPTGDTPEVSTMLLLGTGLLAIRAAKKYRRLGA